MLQIFLYIQAIFDYETISSNENINIFSDICYTVFHKFVGVVVVVVGKGERVIGCLKLF